MRAGRLRHRILIESRIESRDEFGGVTLAWGVVEDNVPAEIVPLSGREFLAAGELQGEVTTRMTIRYMPGIEANMRVQHDGQVYRIVAALPDPTLRRHITLMCATGAGDGR